MYKLLFGLLLVFLVACSEAPSSSGDVTTASEDQKVYQWKMITSWPKNLPALGTSPVHFAEIVDKMSNGRM